MIYVARSAPCPEKLAADGAEELEAWRKFKKNPKGKKPKFKAYALPEVRQELERMFHGKCAYCESFIGHISSIDVEHWRPKGRVVIEGSSLVEGYWWLAAAWANLYPACPHCNRPTKHDLPDGGTTAGKGMRFPVKPSRSQPPNEGDELHEQPLILDPCDADPQRAPERHLEYATELESDGIIRAADDGSGGEDEFGAASIATYALNRPDLVERRAELAKDIRLAIVTIDDLVADLDELQRDSERRERKLNMIGAQVRRLRERLADPAEYLLLARQLAESYLADTERRLNN